MDHTHISAEHILRDEYNHMRELVERAQEFAEEVAPKQPPYAIPSHSMMLPGMRTPIQQRAEQWLEDVRFIGLRPPASIPGRKITPSQPWPSPPPAPGGAS